MKNTNDHQKDAEEMLLTVMKYIKGELNQNEASKELQSFGFSEKNISIVLNKTPRNNVVEFKKYKHERWIFYNYQNLNMFDDYQYLFFYF